MSRKAYTVLGWIIWQVGFRAARREVARNRNKLAAAGVVAAVLAGGIVAARAGADDE